MSYTATLTVSSGKVASDLTGFPVRVDLSHLPAGWWTDTSSDLGNVRVKLSGTVIPFDVVAYDRTAKTGELFFRAPSMLAASDNVFTVETVDSATALAATDPNGRNAVWADYMAVFVTSGVGMADRLKDRSGKSGDLTVTAGTLGTPTNPGWLKGSGDVNVKSVGVGLNTTFHMGASYVMSSASGNNSMLAYSTDTSTDGHREVLGFDSGDNLSMYNSTNSFYDYMGSPAATPNTVPGVRERAVGVKNGTTHRYMYKNGVKGTTSGSVSARPTSPGNAFWLLCGYGGTGSRFFGEINYVYLRAGVPTNAWVAAEYTSWETPASFYSVIDGVPADSSGSLGAVLPGLEFSSGGAFTESGTLDASLPALAASGSGGPPGGPTFGGLDATLPALSVSAAGEAPEVLELDGGVGFAEELPDLVVPPADVPDPRRLIPMVAVSVPPVELVNGRPTQAWKDQAVVHRGVWGAPRLLVGGYDWTLHRGYPFQGAPEYVDPFGYSTFQLTLPSVTPWETEEWMQPGGGTGDLAGLSEWAQVVLQVVDPAGDATTLWRGFVGSVDPQDDGLHLTCAGEATGRLNAAIKTPRPFMFRKDVGLIAYDLTRRPGLRVTPPLGIETGVIIDERSRSGGTLLECLNEVLALGQQGGQQLTIMPTGAHGDVYEMKYRDEETIHATVFYGAHGVTPDLQSNLLDKPTTLHGIGRESDGGVWANIKAPGLFESDPPPFPGVLSPGESSDDVNTLQIRLNNMGYLDREDSFGGFNEATEDAVKDLQEDAGLAQTGVVNEATWKAAFDIDVTGTSLALAHSEPLAQLSSVKRWNTTASGAIAGENPDYDRLRPDVYEMTDYGVYRKRNARKRARARRQRLSGAKMWAGTLRLETDLFVGDYHHGDPDPELMSRFAPLAGLNIMFRGWDGDTLLHVATDPKDATGTTLQVDTMGRPSLEVKALVERNQEGRRNPAKTFLRQHRGIELGGIGEWWSEIGGVITSRQPIQGGRWNVLEGIVAGDMGTLAQVALEMEDAVEFACALFAIPVNDAWCNAELPDPFAEPKAWASEAVRDMAKRRRILLEAWGDKDQPCGYGDGAKTEGAALDGTFVDAAGLPYRTFADDDVNNGKRCLLYWAVFPKSDTAVKKGRSLWPNPEVGM